MSDAFGIERYVEYRQRVEAYRAEHPEQRAGQAAYNVLYEFDPEAARQVHGTPLDPYECDYETLNEFRSWLRARWSAL